MPPASAHLDEFGKRTSATHRQLVFRALQFLRSPLSLPAPRPAHLYLRPTSTRVSHVALSLSPPSLAHAAEGKSSSGVWSAFLRLSCLKGSSISRNDSPAGEFLRPSSDGGTTRRRESVCGFFLSSEFSMESAGVYRHPVAVVRTRRTVPFVWASNISPISCASPARSEIAWKSRFKCAQQTCRRVVANQL